MEPGLLPGLGGSHRCQGVTDGLSGPGPDHRGISGGHGRKDPGIFQQGQAQSGQFLRGACGDGGAEPVAWGDG